MVNKNIPDSPFSDDDGSADPALRAALGAWAEDRTAHGPVLEALAEARLLVPVVAVLGEVEEDENGLRREKTSDMAVPTLKAGHRTALPAFTSTEALALWDPEARPVAVPLHQALQAAAHEKADTIVLDEIKKRDPSLPVLMISGHGNLDTAVAAIRQGAADFIEKPTDTSRFFDEVTWARLRAVKAQYDPEGVFSLLLPRRQDVGDPVRLHHHWDDLDRYRLHRRDAGDPDVGGARMVAEEAPPELPVAVRVEIGVRRVRRDREPVEGIRVVAGGAERRDRHGQR